MTCVQEDDHRRQMEKREDGKKRDEWKPVGWTGREPRNTTGEFDHRCSVELMATPGSIVTG